MRRVVAILFAGYIVALGAGAMEAWHDRVHAIEDAQDDALRWALGLPVAAHHEHDENNCDVHAQLHIPLLLSAWTGVLFFLGLLVISIVAAGHPWIDRRVHVRLDCRGPPAISCLA
jgi:GAF domain-containing protein